MEKQTQIQEEIIQKALKFYETERFGYIDGAMRLGKIKISIEILSRYYVGLKLLITYPNNKIRASWEQEFIKWRYLNPNIIFVNFSSLHKYKAKVFDFIIIDEFHEASDNERDFCQQIMTNSKDTRVLALSGTVSIYTKNRWGLKEIAKYTTNEGIEDGILADYRIRVHMVELDTKIKTPNKKGKMLSEKQRYSNLTYVIEKMKMEGGNYMFLTLTRNRVSISSIGKMNYVRKLLDEMKDKRVIVFTGLTEIADSIGIPSYHSKSPDDKNFIDFQEGRINQLALCESGKVGVSYKHLEGVILLNFTGSKENSAQAINRAIQLDYPNKCAQIDILCLNEEPEIRKVKETLSMLDKSKITYI